MSHTTEISGIKFIDIQALQAAVVLLNNQGIKCTLRENAKPRAYFADQQNMGVAPYILELTDGKYDVGFYADSENPKALIARCDFHAGYIAKFLGVPPGQLQAGETPEQGYLGKLYQAYAVEATARTAVKQGYRVSRSSKADGSVQLIVNI
jgi:hypothetical protein